MSILVKNSKVRVGKKSYQVGETIDGLPKKEEKRLVDSGICDYAKTDGTVPDPVIPNPDVGANGPNTSIPGV